MEEGLVDYVGKRIGITSINATPPGWRPAKWDKAKAFCEFVNDYLPKQGSATFTNTGLCYKSEPVKKPMFLPAEPEVIGGATTQYSISLNKESKPMTAEQFEKILNDQLVSIKETLSCKGKEYASNDDRLYNFKRAAEILQTTPQQALLGMWAKHLVSVLDLIEGRLEPTPHLLDEKIGDTINYLILLKAVLIEKIEA